MKRGAVLKNILPAVLCCTFLLTGKVYAFNDLHKLQPDDFKQMYADSWRVIGKNVIIEGNAYLPLGSMEIYADKIVVNTESRDFEAIGNVQLFRWADGTVQASLKQLADLEHRRNIMVRKVTRSASFFGENSYSVSFSKQTDQMLADKITGNLGSSYFEMINPRISYATFVCKAASGVRTPDGVITLKDAEVSACEYLKSDNAHYSIAASEIKVTPHEAKFYDAKYIHFDKGDSSILLINGMVKIYGVPLLWLPVFYKPKDENPGIAAFTYGKDSDLGYFFKLKKGFVLSHAPYFKVNLLADWYEKRGFGYGTKGEVATQNSWTDFLAYSIYDRDRYGTDDYDKYRLKVPRGRYKFRLSNVTHITPRLDFRSVLDIQSDAYFSRDFFYDVYTRDPQPATFAALEQQFDRFSMAAYTRFRVNDFYTTVEKMPELRMDIPRQEIFNSGVYYQGDINAAYMRMAWIDFDHRAPKGYDQLKDYSAFRLDTTHFLYYPISNRYFTLVPRAGFKLTSYSKSSKKKVSDDDLKNMFAAAEPQNNGEYRFTSYDAKGGSKVRLAAELGFELSTKIHNTWQDVRSGFFQLDGLRHVMQPYVNYTFIPKPTLDRKRIYFFDDIDRITKQNFFRFGMINRLQTRDGNSVKDLFYMENYWDIHLEKYNGMSAFGNIGTLLRWNIFKDLSVNTEFLIDVGNDNEVADTIRHNRNAGKTGLALDWLNYWDINLTWTPAKNWEFAIGYNYARPYDMRSSYSMGSTLTQINSASYFEQYKNDTDEGFYLRGSLPLTPDHRTLGSFSITYDAPEGSLDEISFSVLRQFHCWQLLLTAGFDREYEDGDSEWDLEYSVSANLTGLNSAMNNVQNSVLRQMTTFEK